MTIEISKLAQIIFEEYQNEEDNEHFGINIVSIKKIDNVYVDTYIVFRQVREDLFRMFFVVKYDSDIYGSLEQSTIYSVKLLEKQEEDFILEDVQFGLEKIKEMLPNLRYNLLTSEMNDITKHFRSIEFCDFFGINYFDIDDCCVCHEKTKLKTNCGHTLCAICWGQLKKRLCPICRNCLHHNHNDEE